MPRKRQQSAQPLQEDKCAQYWRERREEFGRNLFFLDTGAILGSLEKDDQVYSDFFDSLVSETLITSSYVVMETVRRLVKDKHDSFAGPQGQRAVQLALYVIKDWIAARDVRVLHVPREVYTEAIEEFNRRHYIGCDLNDILSAQIVRGLEQDRIVASDKNHFLQLGLNCLPS
ncbi:MAG: PIN domain-containing protein [Vicinamibacterales bacterium]